MLLMHKNVHLVFEAMFTVCVFHKHEHAAISNPLQWPNEPGLIGDDGHSCKSAAMEIQRSNQ